MELILLKRIRTNEDPKQNYLLSDYLTSDICLTETFKQVILPYLTLKMYLPSGFLEIVAEQVLDTTDTEIYKKIREMRKTYVFGPFFTASLCVNIYQIQNKEISSLPQVRFLRVDDDEVYAITTSVLDGKINLDAQTFKGVRTLKKVGSRQICYLV